MDAQPKMVRVNHLEFHKSEAGNTDIPYQPIGDRVLVMVDEIATKTSGGIELPFDTIEKQNAASQTGVIIAMGHLAFHWTFDKTRVWEGPKPEPGDRIFFERYAGAFVPGADGKWYRIMDDKQVAAIETRTEEELIAPI